MLIPASLCDLPSDLSHRFGERPAFGHLGESLSYVELDILSRRVAAWFQHNTDLQPGERIALQLPNIMQYPVVLFGALRAGLIVVSTSPSYTPEELERHFTQSGARALVVYDAFAWKAARILARTPIEYVITTRIADLHPRWKRWPVNMKVRYRRGKTPAYRFHAGSTFKSVLELETGRFWEPPLFHAQDVALLQYTGGTTGPAKGAMLTHASLISNIHQLRTRLSEAGLEEGQRLFQPLPLYHGYSLTVVLLMMSLGSYVELIPDPRNLRQLAKAFEKINPTVIAGVNPLFVALSQHAEFTQLDFSSLRLTISGGMALTESTANRWHQVTGCVITEGYGLTECSPVVSVAEPGRMHPGSVGRPLPDTQVRIIGDNGEVLPTGETGRIQVKGPQLMAGYWDGMAIRSGLSGGWFATGDIGQLDDRGELRVIEREQEVIHSAGFKVYPTELENVISDHPGILECAVIGVPDEELGESIKAYIVANNPRLTPRDVRDYCRERLTSYKVPRSVEFCRDLPRTSIGKVQRRRLRDQALSEMPKLR
ncbi:AMP-binding protein [Marinobacterium litorale]|uniref:AMP-binding protein n=1 Tax=Marinobacterium litorale TaxID=404770 RepID=UPI000423F3E8|nr:AMP-binding protein [Marinobacterium litorale]